MDRSIKRAPAALAFAAGLALAGCATPQAVAPTVAPSCPATLDYVRPNLVTPMPDLEEFIGKAELDETFNKPVDEMIAKSGGIERSLVGVQRTIDEYKRILADSAQVRRDYHAAGETDHWIDTYLSSVQDGVTINQAFFDAVQCRQRQAGTTAGTD
jgi:hypothetical protein